MANRFKQYISLLGLLLMVACSGGAPSVDSVDKTDTDANIFPDYKGVTVPSNIAPLNFKITDHNGRCSLLLSSGGYGFQTESDNGKFDISAKEWRKLLEGAKGASVEATVMTCVDGQWKAYKPFQISVAPSEIDGYLAYRLIPPGYELWNEMGIYQRNLSNFDETAIIKNTSTTKNCMNCHSFCMQSADKMLFHMRAKHDGTYIIKDGNIEKLNTKTDKTGSPLVYPSWHPGGRYVAFSINTTNQGFHVNDRNRIEVYDSKSDVVVYDTEKREILTTDKLYSNDYFETFPTFSPDGKTLYFCTAKSDEMPANYRDIKYSLCSISFDPDERKFGAQVDTLFNGPANDKTVSFPRVSPDGHYLMFTMFDYGNFSIWHKEADLQLLDIATGDIRPLDEVNSDDVESYHSWSSNSRWFVFSSRRHDGLYTRPFIAYIDEEGNVSKPFVLPQKDPDFYFNFMMSYNIPELVKDKVNISEREIALKAKNYEGDKVSFIKK